MRPVYFILRIVLPYTFTVFFKRRKIIKFQWKWFNQAIYVSNHPSAFLDPLIVANDQVSVIHFMTRGDIFKPWLKPITWAAHMVPIFRLAEDGDDSAEKNKDIFKSVRRLLTRKRNLIMFGEGYTDDVFIRRLKPLKKGPARLGFEAMEKCNWEENIKIVPVCANYSNPGVFRSEIVTCFGDPIFLKAYKTLYQENPAKAVTQLTRDIDKAMKQNLTHIENKDLAPFLEQILSLTRKGLHINNYNPSIRLRDRFRYSQRAANIINENYSEDDGIWTTIKSEVEEYFKTLEKKGIDDRRVAVKTNVSLRILYLILGLPIAIIGILHCGIPYIAVKKLVEKLFRRRVFWSGVKLILGALFALLFNLPFIWIFHDFVYPSYWLGFLYFISIPALTWIFAYGYIRRVKSFAKWRKADKSNFEELKQRRIELNKKIAELGF